MHWRNDLSDPIGSGSPAHRCQRVHIRQRPSLCIGQCGHLTGRFLLEEKKVQFLKFQANVRSSSHNVISLVDFS